MASYAYTFASGDTITPQRLNDARTVSNIVDADISASAAIAGSKLANDSVTAAKLAATLDLSSKTVTLPNDSVTNDKLSLAANDGEIKKALNADNSPPIFACRAFVNFDPQGGSPVSGTYSQNGTTVTATVTAHGQKVGHVIDADITSGTAVDGAYTVATVADANTFTYTAGTSLTTSGSISLRRRTINSSGNVASVAYIGVGQYRVNLDVAMPSSTPAVVSGFNMASAPAVIRVSTVSDNCISVATNNAAGTATDGSMVSIALFA
jgi:hypothetical protein